MNFELLRVPFPADVLKGKRCTAYPAVAPACRSVGATWVNPDPIDLVVTDGAALNHPPKLACRFSLLAAGGPDLEARAQGS